MENKTELMIFELSELIKANIELNKAQLCLQMETLEIQYTKWPEQSQAFLFALFSALYLC